MKKYLMAGIAAVAICTALTGCSHDADFEQTTPGQQVQEKYNRAFLNYLGVESIDPDQDWGFGETSSLTRLGATSSANTNHNEWAAIDNVYKLLVPPAITEQQALRVKAYFQTHRYLTYEDPGWTKFFVQQVYKGHTNTTGSLSSEEYTQANTNAVIGSDHMNKLTVGYDEQHVNDFNNGTGGPADVLNNGTQQNNYVPNGTTHKDMITLMMNASTACVGFHVTEGNVQHNDCCALVSAQVIDDWARAQNPVIGADVYYGNDINGVPNSFWERSFVGLDYEQKNISQIYRQKNGRDYATIRDFMNDEQNTPKIMYQGQLKDKSEFNLDAALKNPYNQNVRWVDDNTNEYLGDNLGTNQNTFNKQANGVKYFDLDALYSYINQGALPKLNNMEFIRNLGGRDYVFSDWIVTLSPAKSIPTEEVYDLKIIAEDLSATSNSDFDFNDIVLEVKYGSPAKVRLTHAGGTLPLRINDNDLFEVHKLFGVQVNEMVNTGMGPNCPAVLLNDKGLNVNIANAAEANTKLKLSVYKAGDWQEMKAPKGEPACKLAVGMDYNVLGERQSIKTAYEDFVPWATRTGFKSKWWGN